MSRQHANNASHQDAYRKRQKEMNGKRIDVWVPLEVWSKLQSIAESRQLSLKKSIEQTLTEAADDPI